MSLPKLRFCEPALVNAKVLELFSKSKNDQRSDAWLTNRRGFLTASDVATVLDQSEKCCGPYLTQFPESGLEPQHGKPCNPYSNKLEFYLRKCGKGVPFNGNEATLFGQFFEPIAQQVYQQTRKVDLLEFGLVQDPLNPWLAASPDGITTSGVNVEIKCPLMRPASGVPPLGYWIQMQIQMQTCDLDDCDYVCCSFVEFLTEESWLEHYNSKPESERVQNGVLMYGIVLSDSDRKEKEYAEFTVNTIEGYQKFAREHPRKHLSPRYYCLDQFYVTRVPRSREWFQNVVGDLRAVWQTMRDHQQARGSTIEPPAPKRRKQEPKAVTRPCSF